MQKSVVLIGLVVLGSGIGFGLLANVERQVAFEALDACVRAQPSSFINLSPCPTFDAYQLWNELFHVAGILAIGGLMALAVGLVLRRPGAPVRLHRPLERL